LAPTRHALGAALLDAGRAGEAERVFRQDLHHYPDNGWSLLGLSQAAARQGNAPAAQAAEQRFRSAWSEADFPLTLSRL